MARKIIPIISQSSITLLTKKDIFFKIRPSNSVYFNRYPYKIVFNFPLEKRKSPSQQLKYLRLDLSAFTKNILKGPNRLYMVSEKPTIYIHDYKDLTSTLALYKDYILEVHGPTSQDHLDLLYSSNFKCQSKNNFWYNLYDCRVEIWLPIKYRQNYIKNFKPQFITVYDNDDSETTSILTYIKENLNVYVSRNWSSGYCTTLYCKFDELLDVYPFIKMSYPNHRLDITKAVLNTK